MRTSAITLLLAAAFAAAPVHAQKKDDATRQLNQANQSGRTFDGNRAGSGNSTLNQRDAVVAKPPAAPARTPEQAIKDYRASGSANPGPKIKPSAEPPSPVQAPAKKK